MRTRTILAFTAVLLVPTPGRADPAPLHVQLDTSLDPAAVLAHLADELDRAVVPVGDGAPCPEPCLRIVAEGASATVTYVAPGRVWRERTVIVPAASAARLDTVVLLAGNVVRDEASDLLVALDEPAPAAPPSTPVLAIESPPEPIFEPPPAPTRTTRRRPVGVGLVPLLSSDLAEVGTIRHAWSLNAAIGASGGVDGASISGAIDVQAGSVHGLQLAGAIAVAPDVDGSQIAGAISIARDVRGTQLAGAIAVARDVDVQISGALNVARRPRLQIGVVNVSGDPDVVPIGVINIVRRGRTDIEATVDTGAVGTAILRHGGRRWHSVYAIGGQRAEDSNEDLGKSDEDLWMYGLGMGPTWRSGPATIDVDAIAWQVNHGTWHDDRLSLLAQLRTTVAWPLLGVAAVGGVAVNTYIRDEQTKMNQEVGVRIWPSAFAGVRF